MADDVTNVKPVDSTQGVAEAVAAVPSPVAFEAASPSSSVLGANDSSPVERGKQAMDELIFSGKYSAVCLPPLVTVCLPTYPSYSLLTTHARSCPGVQRLVYRKMCKKEYYNKLMPI